MAVSPGSGRTPRAQATAGMARTVPTVAEGAYRFIVNGAPTDSYVADVRQGKFFEIDVEARTADQAFHVASEVANKVLANPIIESYRVEIPES